LKAMGIDKGRATFQIRRKECGQRGYPQAVQ
jgi:ribosomal protein L37E